jgi:PAS domain S-box-containing protein
VEEQRGPTPKYHGHRRVERRILFCCPCSCEYAGVRCAVRLQLRSCPVPDELKANHSNPGGGIPHARFNDFHTGGNNTKKTAPISLAGSQQSQARLIDGERDLQLSIDTIPVFVAMYRPDGTRTFVNRTWQEYMGLTLEEATGAGAKTFPHFHPDDAQRNEQAWRAALQNGQPLDIEVRVRRADGKYRWHMSRRAPLRDEQGTIVRWYSVGIDIEDQKAAEDALRRSEEALRREVIERTRAEQLARIDEARFRRFFDLPLIGMAVTSPQRRFLEVNEKLCQIVGYPREELIGRDWGSITHPDDLPWNLGLLDEAMAGTTETYGMDKRYIHRDGQIVYVSISVCCIRRADGTPDHFVLTVQDVTARRQVQELLERTEAHLKHGHQIAHCGSYEVHLPQPFGAIWSDEHYRMFGLEPGSPVPSMEQYLERYVHPDDREYFRDGVTRRASADRRFTLEYRFLRADGEVRYLQSITDPVRDESGRVVKLVGTAIDITERKIATERLETQTALLDQLFQSVAEATVLLDLDDRVLRVNTEFSRMFGYTDAQARGLGINDLIVPAEKIQEAAGLSSDLARGQMCNAESVRRRADGSRLQVSILGAPIVSGGRQIASYAIYRDITERKRIEEAQARHARHVALRADVHAAFSRAADPLQEVLRRGVEAIVHNLHGALARIWTLDHDAGVLELRASAGLSTQLDGLYSRIRVGHLMIGRMAQDRAPHFTNDVLNDPDLGDREWARSEGVVAFVGVPLLIEGRVAGVVAMFARHAMESDTLEAFQAIADTIAQGIGRRRAEEALRESEQRFRDYASAASDWLWETGPDHRFTWFSLRNTQIHQPDNRVGRARWEIAADVEDEPEKWRLHRAILDAHEPFRDFTYRTVQADGSAAYLAVSGKPVFDAQGAFHGYRGVASDVTAAMRAEQAEKALHQAQAQLAHVARVTSLGALTASIAHEVNQPLTGIINNASTCLRMLAADPPNIDGARETTRRTLRDGNRASEVIARLRTLFSKKDAVLDAVDLNEAAREVLAMSLSELQRERLVARLELAEDLPPVVGDRVQLQQVILNLLLNAADAMSDVHDRPRHLVIRSERDTDHRVRFSVQDVGVGLEAQSMEKLFEAFYTTKPNGMGIGLSVSRSIIERHHGRLWAAPNDGPGATFSFSIPCLTS